MSHTITPVTAEAIDGDVCLLAADGELVLALTPTDAWELATSVLKQALIAGGDGHAATGFVTVKL